MLPSRRRNRFLDSCLRFLTPAPFPSAPSHARTLARMVAVCAARRRPAPRNKRTSTINHVKTCTAWCTSDWGCGHACTGRGRIHRARHALPWPSGRALHCTHTASAQKQSRFHNQSCQNTHSLAHRRLGLRARVYWPRTRPPSSPCSCWFFANRSKLLPEETKNKSAKP